MRWLLIWLLSMFALMVIAARTGAPLRVELPYQATWEIPIVAPAAR